MTHQKTSCGSRSKHAGAARGPDHSVYRPSQRIEAEADGPAGPGEVTLREGPVVIGLNFPESVPITRSERGKKSLILDYASVLCEDPFSTDDTSPRKSLRRALLPPAG